MADNTLIKIAAALLKHQVKKLVGEDALGIVGQELTAIGGNKLDEQVKSWLGEKTNADELEKAADYALDIFRGKVNDDVVKQWMAMLPLHNLPAVISAFEELPASPDESKLESTLRESIFLNWKGLSSVQVENAVDTFLYSLRSALLPIEKQTLTIIGRSVLRTEDKVNQLIHLIEQFITEFNIKSAIQIKPATAPRPLDDFIGREKILTEIKSILINKTQPDILAIIGMGGIGKTSLALQIAKDVKDEFVDNIFWGDLNEFEGDAIRILRLWAGYCGQELPARAKAEELANQVRGLLTERQKSKGPILIVIDDLRENWLEAGEILCSAAPANTPIVITTREMKVAQSAKASKVFNLEEQKYSLSDTEASNLLVTRSENKVNVPQSKIIAGLCEKMPLALELASQVAKADGSVYLLNKLNDAVERLDTLKLDNPSRKEQCVRMTFDISYESLLQNGHANAALVFRYLGAFASSAITASHLSEVFSYSKNMIDVDKDLRLLRKYSLLQNMDYNDKESPYRIHTLLHDYAKSLLKEKEASEARQGHFACFQNFAQSYADVDLIDRNDKVQAFETFYPQMMQALANFEQEYNVKNSNLKSKQLQSAIELIDILDKRWALHDSFDAQVKWLAIGYDVARKIKKPLKQAGFARRVGRVNGWLGELDDGLKWMKKCATALGSSKSREANTIRAHMYIHRASLKYQKNSLKEAGKDCADGVKMVTQKSQPGIYAEGYNLLGVIKIRTNQLSSASELLEKSLSAWKQVGDQYQISRVEENIRSALYYLGDIASLRSAEEAGLKYWEQFPERIQYATALTNRGLVHYIDEEYETAVELHKRAMQISDSHGHSRLSALTRVNLAYPYISLGKYDEAETLLNESMAVQEEHDIMEYWINAKCCQAELEIGRGHYAEAIKFAEVAVKLAEEDDDPLEKGTALRALGQACYLNGDLKQAKEHLENSLTLLREDEYKYEVYLTLRALGKMDNSYDGEAQSLAKEIGLR